MADSLRAGQAGTQNRQRSVRAPRTARRPRYPSSSLDLEVIAEGREGSAPDGAHREESANEDPESVLAAPSRDRTRTSPPPTSKPSLKGHTVPRHEEDVYARPVLISPYDETERAKHIPEVIIIPDQVDRPHYRVVPSPSSADNVTESFRAEFASHATFATQSNRAKESFSQSSLDHAEERAQFRKLYWSDSQGTPAERVERLLSQSSQEHAAERARYRNLYFSDQGKDVAAAWQDVSEAHSATSGQEQQEPRHGASVTNTPEPDELPDIARLFGTNAKENITMDRRDSFDDLAEPCKNVRLYQNQDLSIFSLLTDHQNAPPTPKEIPNRKSDTSTRPAASWMDQDTRKCLLCDGRRFPGDAFYRHERESQRHRDNLSNHEKVAKAKARRKKIESRKFLNQFAESVMQPINGPPTQHPERPSQESSRALSPARSDRHLSLPPPIQESVATGSNLSHGAKIKKFMQRASHGDALSRATEQHSAENNEDNTYSPPLKRKRPMLEAEEGRPSTHIEAKRAKADPAKNGKARDDVLVQISSTDLDKLVQLHPEIFDTDWNQRSTPAPDGWQAIGPSASAKPRVPRQDTACRRQAPPHGSEEVQIVGSRACPGDSSEASRDYLRFSSLCDDSADSDYQDEEDPKEEEEDDDDEDMMEEEE